MSNHRNECGIIANSGYGSADETSTLLTLPTTTVTATNNNIVIAVSASTAKLATLSSANSTTKPVLMRQDRTSTYLASPNLSQTIGYSEESGQSNEDSDHRANSVTDLDIQYHRLETPVISISNVCQTSGDSGGSTGRPATVAPSSAQQRGSISGYQLTPHTRCRACRSCDRRASTTPVSTLYLARSASRESVRSTTATHHGFLAPSNLTAHHHHQHQHQHNPNQRVPPPVYITGSPLSGSRIIRQSSQPEASNIVCCSGSGHSVCAHSQTAPSVSLRQLREPSDGGIAGIAADSLRFNGAMRPFKQVHYRLGAEGWFAGGWDGNAVCGWFSGRVIYLTVHVHIMTGCYRLACISFMFKPNAIHQTEQTTDNSAHY